MREVASDVDVLYMTRIQKERFSDMKEYEKAKGKYILNADLMKSMHKDAVVLHPLPRVDEVRKECRIWLYEGCAQVILLKLCLHSMSHGASPS